MRNPSLFIKTFSVGSALAVAAAAAVGVAALRTAGAQPAAATALPPVAPAAPTTQAADAAGAAGTAAGAADQAVPAVPSVLSNKTAGPAGPVQLAERPFETVSGGIALRYPAGSKAMREVGKDDLVELRDDARHWSLVVSRRTYPQPMSLVSLRDARGNIQPGILEQTAAAVAKEYGDPELLKKGQPGLRLLRQDLTNLGKYDVGVLAYRYTRDTVRYFAQRAVIEANDQVYYLVALTTPARTEPVIPMTADGEEATEDAGERQAAEAFRAILDSVRLLDRGKIRTDQDQRLYRTRTLMQNWTEKKLASVLLPEQYMRVLKQDDKGNWNDVGWRYVVEEPERKGNEDGIRVGIHTCYCEAGPLKPTEKAPRTEMEAWMSVSMNRKHEDWSSQVVTDDGTEHSAQHPWRKLIEFGTSDLKSSRYLVVDPRDGKQEHMFDVGTNEDPHQPWVGMKDSYTLNVQYAGTVGDTDPVSQPLQVFYLPQALDSMLPRLLPPNEVKSYMMSTYVTDARAVMMRYVEVNPARAVTLMGRTFQAVPITDHIGWEGSVTTHYVSSTGQYLGSENKDTKTVVVPTDKQTLTNLWPDAQLRSPGDLGAAPAPVAADPWRAGPGSAGSAGSAGAPGSGRAAAGNRRGTITVGPDAGPGGPAGPDRAAPNRARPSTAMPSRPGSGFSGSGLPDSLGTDPIVPERVTPPRGGRDER